MTGTTTSRAPPLHSHASETDQTTNKRLDVIEERLGKIDNSNAEIISLLRTIISAVKPNTTGKEGRESASAVRSADEAAAAGDHSQQRGRKRVADAADNEEKACSPEDGTVEEHPTKKRKAFEPSHTGNAGSKVNEPVNTNKKLNSRAEEGACELKDTKRSSSNEDDNDEVIETKSNAAIDTVAISTRTKLNSRTEEGVCEIKDTKMIKQLSNGSKEKSPNKDDNDEIIMDTKSNATMNKLSNGLKKKVVTRSASSSREKTVSRGTPSDDVTGDNNKPKLRQRQQQEQEQHSDEKNVREKRNKETTAAGAVGAAASSKSNPRRVNESAARDSLETVSYSITSASSTDVSSGGSVSSRSEMSSDDHDDDDGEEGDENNGIEKKHKRVRDRGSMVRKKSPTRSESTSRSGRAHKKAIDENGDGVADMSSFRREFEEEKERVFDLIPLNVKKRFRQFAFAKRRKVFHPVLELSPYDVAPGPMRQKCIAMMICEKTKKTPSDPFMKRLVYWYGNTWTDNDESSFSFLPKTHLKTLKDGLALGLDKPPPVLLRKIDCGKKLTEVEQFRIRALEQFKVDRGLAPEQRIRWMMQFKEDYEWREEEEERRRLCNDNSGTTRSQRKGRQQNQSRKNNDNEHDDDGDDDDDSDDDTVDEEEKAKVLQYLPLEVKSGFGQQGFSKWRKTYLPILEISPFDVGSTTIVHGQWMDMFNEKRRLGRPVTTRLIFWYGSHRRIIAF